MPSDSPTAVRSRAYRKRRRVGTVIVPIEVGVEAQKALLDNQLIDPDMPPGRAAIADGIVVLLEFLKDGEITAPAG